MSTEDEFTRYRELYDNLQKRVERLARQQDLVGEVRARLADLARQMEDFSALEEIQADLDGLTDETAIVNLERPCAMCGEAFYSHLDERLCLACRDPD